VTLDVIKADCHVLMEKPIAATLKGKSPIEGKEPDLAELLRRVVAAGQLRATTDYAPCREARVVLIAVETPVDPVTKKPGCEALRGALTDLAKNLSLKW
jgi:UDP-N-acetyl-D-mannosaminuronate dehydrogenase